MKRGRIYFLLFIEKHSVASSGAGWQRVVLLQTAPLLGALSPKNAQRAVIFLRSALVFNCSYTHTLPPGTLEQ